MEVTLPNDLSDNWVTAVGCSLTVNGASGNCNLNGNTLTGYHTSTSSVAGATFKYSLTTFRQPYSTRPTGNFKVVTYEYDSNAYSIVPAPGPSYEEIDKYETFTFASTVLGDLSSATVVRDGNM